MTYRKFGLGLVVAAISLMAFASSAQALIPEFVIGGAKALHANASGAQVGAGYLLVPALSVEFRCDEFEVQEGLLLAAVAPNHAIGHAKLLYKKCVPLDEVTLVALHDCFVGVSHVDNSPAHITATALLLPVEFASGDWGILAEKIVAKILVRSPAEECLLPESNTVTGELCFLIDGNETVKPLLLTNKAIQQSCPERPALESLSTGPGVKDKLLYGAQEAFVDGTAHLFLTGAHDGKTIGVLLL